MRIEHTVHAELRAKYTKLLAFVKKTYNKRFVSPVKKDDWYNIIEEAKELLKEIEGDSNE